MCKNGQKEENFFTFDISKGFDKKIREGSENESKYGSSISCKRILLSSLLCFILKSHVYNYNYECCGDLANSWFYTIIECFKQCGIPVCCTIPGTGVELSE